MVYRCDQMSVNNIEFFADVQQDNSYKADSYGNRC